MFGYKSHHGHNNNRCDEARFACKAWKHSDNLIVSPTFTDRHQEATYFCHTHAHIDVSRCNCIRSCDTLHCAYRGNFSRSLKEDAAQFFSVDLSPAQRTRYCMFARSYSGRENDSLWHCLSLFRRVLSRKIASTINLTHDTRRRELIYWRLRIRV